MENRETAQTIDTIQTDNASEKTNDVEKNVVLAEEDPDFIQNGTSHSTSHSIQGLKYHLLIAGLCLSIFLVNFEITIVSTSLVSITNDLKQFKRSSWVITGYLLSYVSFMVILAKLSDLVGRKLVLIGSLAIFTLFSGICGAAQTMTQLIVFRAFQGLGGSGVYSLVMVVLFELVPPAKFAAYTVLVMGLFAISMLTGPLIGGAISTNTTWRWVFLINVPAGALALLALTLCIPNNFNSHEHSHQRTKTDFRKLDFIGAGSMLAGIMLLIVGLEGASDLAPWTSARVLAPILVSLVAWVTFIWYERYITIKENTKAEPVFPWRFCTDRVIMGTFVNAFLSGAVFTSCVIQIPLRFQAVNHESPWKAGVRLIPFAVITTVGSIVCASVTKKLKMPILYMIPIGATLQILGLVFMSRLELDDIFWGGQYGLQALAGFGLGLVFTTNTLMTPYIIKKRDLATATSAVVQIRVLGGALILALIIAVMNSDLRRTLPHLVTPIDFTRIFESVGNIENLAEPTRTAVRETFLKGYNKQLRILIGFAAAQILVSAAQWQRTPVRLN